MVLYDPSNAGINSSKGAMVQANMYAWMAEGLGRVDISADPVISFEYADMERKAKNRVVNPLAHIQFATGLRAVRGVFSEHGARYTTKGKTVLEAVDFPTSAVAGNPYGEYYVQKDEATVEGANSTQINKVRNHSKYLLRPKIDSFNLIPKLAHDIGIGSSGTPSGAGAVGSVGFPTTPRTGATANSTTASGATTTTSTAGAGATFSITVDANSIITSVAVVTAGTGYEVGDTIVVAEDALAGSHAEFNLTVATNGAIDLSAVRTSYVNFELTQNGATNSGLAATGMADTGRLQGATDFDNTTDKFYVYDLSNNGDTDDNSYNILATFKIHAKSKGDGQSTVVRWPQVLAGGNAGAGQYQGGVVDSAKTTTDALPYRINGMPISTYEKSVYDVSFEMTSNIGSSGSGLEKVNTAGTPETVKYIAHVMSGSLDHMRFGLCNTTANGGSDGGAILMPAGGHIDNQCGFMVDQGDQGAAGLDRSIICTRVDQSAYATNADFIADAKLAVNTLDFSFTGITLNDTAGLELNSDAWIGDLILPITGDATSSKKAKESGGLQCVHIPDSIRTLRNDAAQSLAANFAGLTELLGSISITPEPDIAMGEFNLLSFTPGGDASLSDTTSAASDTTVHGPPAGTGDTGRSAHGVFTISGDILINKVKNFMLGSNYTDADPPVYEEGPDGIIARTAITDETRNQHIHKIVYWSNSIQGSADVSLACTCRDGNLSVPDEAGGVFEAAAAVDAANGNGGAKAAVVAGTHFANAETNGADGLIAKTGAFLTELSPQESAFFYIYPWASAEMCAISSAAGAGTASFGRRNTTNGTVITPAGVGTTADDPLAVGGAVVGADFKCNPFRHYQAEYLDGNAAGTYAEGSLDVDSISIAVPTFKGWLDNTHGYYNTEKKRTEWYSFCDICGNSNRNAVQINDASYVYQNLGPMTDATDGAATPVATPRVHDAGMGSDGKPHVSFKPNGAGVAKGAFNKSVLDIVFPDVTNSDGTALLTHIPGNGETVDDGDDFCTLNFRIPLQAKSLPGKKRLDKVYNLNNGVVQLANESYELKNGFTAKVNATADNLSAISANVNELMNAYCPVIIRLMDEDTIGHRGHTGVVAPDSGVAGDIKIGGDAEVTGSGDTGTRLSH